MDKNNIFNDSEFVDDDNCIYDSNKICDNCGKCLEAEGVDIRAIKIEEIAKVSEETSIDSSESLEEEIDDEEDSVEVFDESSFLEEEEYEDAWDHIEYIDDVQNILDDDIALEENSEEIYPGLIRIKRF
jgi:Fe-S-cluster containining protein